MRHLHAIRLLLAAAVLIAASACGGSPVAEQPPKLRVVTTTPVLTDMARVIAGEQASVKGLLPANADPHDYEPRPSDLEALADADVILRSGGEVDDWIKDAVETAGTDARLIDVGQATPAGVAGEPHWWLDPFDGDRAVGQVAQAMMEEDRNNQGAYERRVIAYRKVLDDMDVGIARCMRKIPRAQRKLVTTHDAFGAYAKRYGIEIVGTVIPSRSTRGQASAGQTAELIESIRREKVRTIFPEQSLQPKVEAAIARETGAKVGAPLYADGLGQEGSGAETYLGMLAANTRALAEGFTGRPSTCPLPSR